MKITQFKLATIDEIKAHDCMYCLVSNLKPVKFIFNTGVATTFVCEHHKNVIERALIAKRQTYE